MKGAYEELLENSPTFGCIHAVVNPVKLSDARQGDATPGHQISSAMSDHLLHILLQKTLLNPSPGVLYSNRCKAIEFRFV